MTDKTDQSGHSLLSPSAAERWTRCTPSARQCVDEPDTSSEYALQVTEAHSLLEFRLKTALGQKAKDCQPGSGPTATLKHFDGQMSEIADDYVQFIQTLMSETPNAIVMTEQKVDISRWVPEAKGTCDCLIIGGDVIQIVDIKYGINPVTANSVQFKLYALGAVEAFDYLYDFSTIRMSVFQPRIGNISTWECSKAELLRWAEDELRPLAEMAWNGEGEYKSGKHCMFCKIKARCRERARANLEMARYDFQDPPLLDNIEISAVLDKADEFKSWIKAVEEFALQQALKGENYPGYKVVEGRSNRKYTDETAVTEKVQALGFDPYEHSVLGITKMTDLLGTKKFNEVTKGLIIKPQGKPALVAESDKREAINVNTAADDFADHEN